MADADGKKILFRNYNLSSTSLIYGTLGTLINSPKYLKTTGSSTTVSELNTTDDTFEGYGVGDVIAVNVDGTWTLRTVTAVGSIPNSVTVDTAVDWQNGTAGRAFSYRRFTGGTAATDGWFPVSGDVDKAVEVSIDTINATSIAVSIEGRINGGTAAVLYSKTYTAAGADVFVIPENVTELRVGFIIDTDGGTQSCNAVYKASPRAY